MHVFFHTYTFDFFIICLHFLLSALFLTTQVIDMCLMTCVYVLRLRLTSLLTHDGPYLHYLN